jgi:hypothetical protein
VTAREAKRRIDKVREEMSEVIVNGGPLTAVAQGVQDVNETIAHHAAWTEERFDKVEERLGGLELGQMEIREDISRLDTKVDRLCDRVDGLATRMGNLEIASVGMRAEMVRMEQRLETRMDRMRDEIRGDIDKLAVRMDKVIAFAVRDGLKLDEVSTQADKPA